MKIHGTAKGGAISHKDFGVAFGGGGVVSCELFSQTDGTFDDSNTSSQYGFGVRISTDNTSIGETMISFTLDLKSSNTGTNAALTFGVWASGNDTDTPTAVFTSDDVDNNTDLTTSFQTFTFTGSRTLALNDNICCYWGSPTGSGVIQQQLKNPATMENSLYVKYISGSSSWGSYGSSHIPNMTALQC
tara:strand:+ start:70 stop:633 length:564 start_codon:yes stop_codon:yes gene_type:complete